ncbi:MAG: magnesium transporter MgtC [Thermoplasmatales archaeon SG8-52-3]|nr:MAG: magnesium transporter MgtC [Thermoplasmatales archaeon SG8-52-3]
MHMEIPISWFDIEMIFRILLAVALGSLIGYEREITHKPAGLRTHIFVCMGACLFTIASFYLIEDTTIGSFDSTRIAAGIVTGISFIGAGSIIASKGDVKGVTTAASLWVISAIGLMVGFGIYLIPIIAAIITFLVLYLGRIKKNS